MAGKYPMFTEAEREIIRGAAYRVWQDIACDAIDSLAAAEGKDPEAMTLRRSEVMELALDADRPIPYIQEAIRYWDGGAQKDFLDRFHQATYNQLIKIVKPAFHYERYGL